MSSKQNATMILIVGAGIAGLTTAIALEQKSIDYLIVEAVPEIRAVGAGITLAGNAMKILKRLGVSEILKQRGHLLTSMIIQDEKGKHLSAMDASRLIENYGLESIAIHRGDLHQVLLSKIDKSQIITGKKATGFAQKSDNVTVAFEDGSELSADGVIVADGIHSLFRRKLLPGSLPRYSGYTCWRGVVPDKWNLFGKAVETWASQGRFGYVPIGNGQIYWFACKNGPRQDVNFKSWTISDLAKNFKDFARPIPELIKNTSPDQLIWNDIADLKPLNRFAFDRIVLTGDAAHATTPNLGQGACMGIEDALVIAEELAKTDDIKKAFKAFEERRINRTTFIVDTSSRLGKIAQLENKLLIGIRNALIRLTPESVNEKQVSRILDVDLSPQRI